MAKKKKSGAADAGGGSKGEDKKAPKPTSVSRLVPDPEDIKHDVNRLLGALRAPNKSMSRGDAALFLWDIALNDKNERARLSMEDVAVAAVAAMRKGDHLARSAAASLLAKTSEWKEARARVVAAGAPRELCAILLDTGDRADTVLARRAAVAALRRLAATGDLRAAMSRNSSSERSSTPLDPTRTNSRAPPRRPRTGKRARTPWRFSTRAWTPRETHTPPPSARPSPARASPARRYDAPRKRSSPPRDIRPRPPPPSPPRCGASRISPRTSTAARRCPRTRSSSGCSWRR